MIDVYAIDSIVFTQLQRKVTSQLSSRFPNLSFTTEVSEKVPTFPNVYVHLISTPEINNTLENNVINGYDATFQIEITSNVSKMDAKVTMNACLVALKSMSFSVRLMPYSKINNVHRYIIRARRVLLQGDNL